MSYAAAATPDAIEEPAPSFWERFTGVLVRPRETFARLTDRDAWFWPAIMMFVGYTVYVLAVGLGMQDYMQLVMQSIFQAPGGQRNPASATIEQIIRSLVPTYTVFQVMWQAPLHVAFSWAIRVGVFYGLAVLLGGAKPLWGRVVSMVGWAWVPLFIQYVLIGVLMLASPVVSSLFLPLPTDLKNLNSSRMAWASWQAQTAIAVSPFVVWNLVLCTLGVSELFRLPRWKAALVVVLPIALQLALSFGWVLLTTVLMNANTPQTVPVPNGPAR